MNRRILMCCALASSALFSLPSTASAQVEAPAAAVVSEPAPLSMPDLLTPRVVGAEMTYISLSLDEEESFTLMSLEIHGQYEFIPGVFGYGRLPLTRLGYEDAREGDMGNVTLGVRGVSSQYGPVRVGGSFDVSLPTSPAVDGELFGELDGRAALFTAIARNDISTRYTPDSTTYRFEGHVRQDGPRHFVQGQLGYHRLSDGFYPTPYDILLLTLGGGYKVAERLALVGEFTTTSYVLEDYEGDKFFHWFRLGAQYDGGAYAVGGHLYMPMDAPGVFGENRGDIGLTVDLRAKL